MDEQVVPSFAPSSAGSFDPQPQMRRSTTIKTSLKSLAKSDDAPLAAVPKLPASKSVPEFSSPSAEFSGKPRWQTPLRAGTWPEPWQGARELGTPVCVRSGVATAVGSVVRASVADVVVSYVGSVLPRPTVEKWLCLLCEYLELNADEQVLVVCLLRRYVRHGGRFVGKGDWARPQRWECVVAVACYFAVLLTEEFPGRTSMDLRELLGPNFRFGSEQVTFLKVVDWRISVHAEEFKEVKENCQAILKGDESARATLRDWFQVDRAIADRKRRAAEDAAAAAAAASAAAAARIVAAQSVTMVGKKRAYTAIAPADDSVVPRVVSRIDAPHAIPAAFVPTVPHWGVHW